MDDAHQIPTHFDIGTSEILRFERHGSGHINDTFLASASNGSEVPNRYVFQRINHHVFPDVPAVMENIVRVTNHLREYAIASGCSDPDRRTLTVITTHDGAPYHVDPSGYHWRAFRYIERTRWIDVVANPAQASAAALAFGEFARTLSDLPAPPLHVTIPKFHDTPHRFQDFVKAIELDPLNRADSARDEIDYALSCAPWHGILADAQTSGTVPERIAHNDTKINNVLFDADSEEGICVIDLDTVMPGSALHDFGDLVRTAAATAAEDEKDLDQVGVSLPIFNALAAGFLKACGDVLTPTEIDLLAFSGKLLTFEVGIRFLTDHLLGDTYFKIQHDGHNLDRARAQFRMVKSLHDAEDEMRQSVDQIAREKVPASHAFARS